VGTEPVFRALRAELAELIGEAAYDVLAAHCSALLAARRALPLTVHPATGHGALINGASRKRDHG
jgi:hypothetical protein